MRKHHLEPGPSSLVASFDARPPALTIEPGDILECRTLDVSWGLEPPSVATRPRRRWEPRPDGPCLLGPIAVEGVRPGDTLEIRILKVEPGSWGFTYAGGPGFIDPFLNQRLGVSGDDLLLVKWEIADGWAASDLGFKVAVQPFLGMLGLASVQPTNPWHPGPTGGNFDCRAMTAGSTLFLPVEVAGGLIFLGDGHAAQGDGEVSGTAIECPMESVRLQVWVRRDLPRRTPLLRRPEGWVTFGFSPDLNEAMAAALDEMVTLMMDHLHTGRRQALALASVAVNLHVTQVVNGVRGVHAVWLDETLQANPGGHPADVSN